MTLKGWAEAEAVARLSALPRRLAHTRSVVRKAERFAPIVGGEVDVLIAAAWLHDVGYSEDLAVTRFHPLDGARHLAALGAPERLMNLVARHSCAIVEAKLRGLEREVGAYPDERGLLRDALWYCDMTTSPEGKSVTLEERIEEIQRRYGQGAVFAFTEEARPCLAGAIDRTVRRLRGVPHERQL